MELHWLLCLVITILMVNSVPCSCDTLNDIYSYKGEYYNDELKGNLEQYPPTPYIAQNYGGVGQGFNDRRWKYMRLRQQEKQDAKKLKKLKAKMRKVLPPLLRLLQDEHDDDDNYNYTAENSSY